MKSSVRAYRNQQFKCEIANLTTTTKSNWPSDNDLLKRSEMNRFFFVRTHREPHTHARSYSCVRAREFAASANTHTVHRTNFTFFFASGKWWKKSTSDLSVCAINHPQLSWPASFWSANAQRTFYFVRAHRLACANTHTRLIHSLRWFTADGFLLFSVFALALCVSNRRWQHWSKNQITAMWKSRLIKKTAIKLTTGWRSIFIQ